MHAEDWSGSPGRLAELAERVPNLADYFGVWSIHPETFKSMVERVNSLDLRMHVGDPQSAARAKSSNAERDYEVDANGVATLWIMGPTQKSVGSLQEGTSTVRVRQQLRAAAADPAVRAAMLVMDTPGGTVKGNSDLAAEVARFATQKPIHAYAEDMVASAGVSVASQTGRITANSPTALYGSMGCFSVLEDWSGYADKLGVKVHVVKAGEFKGAGTPGAPITDAQLGEAQRIVDALYEHYVSLIAQGRRMTVDAVRALADGRIHPASDAIGMGLIDAIGTYDEAYQALLGAIPRQPGGAAATRSGMVSGEGQTTQQRSESMSAATLQELKATFPHSTAEWREQQLEAGATLQDAAISYANAMAERAKAAEAKAEEAEKTAAKQQGLGHAPLRLAAEDEPAAGYTGDPVADFNSAVERIAGANPTQVRRQEAIRAVARKNPQLHAAFLMATNPGRRQQRQLSEKYQDIA